MIHKGNKLMQKRRPFTEKSTCLNLKKYIAWPKFSSKQVMWNDILAFGFLLVWPLLGTHLLSINLFWFFPD